ncbi:MAG: YebC/PmpR family DNA-binding transcriptional regulator [Deltaproteobacteria bacterium]|nr:YebC/PmpR family DNA-binding transcriptional regulator [Deltaproteobacteria bacterium]
MSGHSRWANIKHKKARSDAKKGESFTKLVKEITVAAKLGGGDPSANPRLRTAIEKAKAENLPSENIDRAVKKGTGELFGVSYEEGAYEGYGPCGVAVLVNYMTDNKNRTVSEVRRVFTKFGGRLGESGSVGWLFEKRGFFTFAAGPIDEEKLMEAALAAGAEDVIPNKEDGVFEVYSDPADFHKVKSLLDSMGLNYLTSGISMIPKSTVRMEGGAAQMVLRFVEELEDLDDVQDVYSNFDIPASEMEKVA